jgi:hypothetical protein
MKVVFRIFSVLVAMTVAGWGTASAQDFTNAQTVAPLNADFPCYDYQVQPRHCPAGGSVVNAANPDTDLIRAVEFTLDREGWIKVWGTARCEGCHRVAGSDGLNLYKWDGAKWALLGDRQAFDVQVCQFWDQGCTPGWGKGIKLPAGKYRLVGNASYFEAGWGAFRPKTQLQLRVLFVPDSTAPPPPPPPPVTGAHVVPGVGICECVDPIFVSDSTPALGAMLRVEFVLRNKSQSQGTDCAASVLEGPNLLFPQPGDAAEAAQARQVVYVPAGRSQWVRFNVPVRAGATTIAAAVSGHSCNPVTIAVQPAAGAGVAGSVLEVGVLAPLQSAVVYVAAYAGPSGAPQNPALAVAAIRPDPSGRFQHILPPGRYTMWAEAPGYINTYGLVEVGRDVTVQPRRITQPVDFRLAPLPVAQPPAPLLPPVDAGPVLEWAELDADVVGRRFAPNPNGEPDGHFRLYLSTQTARRITYMRLRVTDAAGNPSGPQQWDTDPGQAWILGVVAMGSMRLNPTDQNIAFGVSGGTSYQFDVYANDDGSGSFRRGQHFKLELRYADGGTDAVVGVIP